MQHSNKILLSAKAIDITLTRLAYQVMENHTDLSEVCFIGLQPRGTHFADRLVKRLEEISGYTIQYYGKLDTTFYRDDIGRRDIPLLPHPTSMDFLIERKPVILIDDVLYSGRSIKAAFNAINAFGRPTRIEFMTLIQRRLSLEMPIGVRYLGKQVDSISTEYIRVQWQETHGKDLVEIVERAKE